MWAYRWAAGLPVTFLMASFLLNHSSTNLSLMLSDKVVLTGHSSARLFKTP